MPLTRGTITAASRVMLPVYVVFFTLLGLTYLLTPLSRLLASPGLAYADALLSLRVWGGLFLVAAVVMAAAMVTQSRIAFRFALILCGLSMATFTAALMVAIFKSEASPAAWSWSAFVVAACVASERSLAAGEQ